MSIPGKTPIGLLNDLGYELIVNIDVQLCTYMNTMPFAFNSGDVVTYDCPSSFKRHETIMIPFNFARIDKRPVKSDTNQLSRYIKLCIYGM